MVGICEAELREGIVQGVNFVGAGGCLERGNRAASDVASRKGRRAQVGLEKFGSEVR